jgi:hypothetical protein
LKNCFRSLHLASLKIFEPEVNSPSYTPSSHLIWNSMSVETITPHAEGSASSGKAVKAAKMIDGREETKEERKARKAAKRAAAQSTAVLASEVASVGAHATPNGSAPLPAEANSKKDKKDKKRKRAEESEGTPAAGRLANEGGDAVPGPSTAGAGEIGEAAIGVIDPLGEKRARKAARKAVSGCNITIFEPSSYPVGEGCSSISRGRRATANRNRSARICRTDIIGARS